MNPVPKDVSLPVGLKWRSGYWYVTFVVWLGTSAFQISGSFETHYRIFLGIAVDLVAYSVVIPVLPFHLEAMGHKNVSSLTGYLLFAYVR